MLEGLWTGEFKSNVSNISTGSSVIVFRDGKCYGGGAISYFIGSYDLNDNKLTGKITITHYSGDPITLFGLIDPGQSLDFEIKAEIQNEIFKMEGTSVENPKMKFFGTLTQRANSERL